MIVALGWFFFFLFPQSKPHSPFLYSALRPVLGYFSPKFEQYKGLGYAFNLKSEREAGTNFMLLGVEKNCLSLERNNDFYQIRAFSACSAHPGWGGREPSGLPRLCFPGECIPVPAQGSLPPRAAQVGDGRIIVRKLNIRIKPQTITSPAVRRFPTKLASSHCGHQNICPWLLRQHAHIQLLEKKNYQT